MRRNDLVTLKVIERKVESERTAARGTDEVATLASYPGNAARVFIDPDFAFPAA
jgi:hypothetical protein